MKAEHTPGPWGVRPSTVSDGDGEVFAESESGDTDAIVCIVWGMEHLWSDGDTQGIANGHLLAAAPELLAALELAVQALADHLQYDDEGVSPSLEKIAYNAAFAAVAKARGFTI